MLHTDRSPQGPTRVPLSRITAPWHMAIVAGVSIMMALLWWFPLRFLGKAQQDKQLEPLDASAQYFLDHPTIILLLPLPAVLASALVLVVKRGKIPLIILSWFLELIPLVVIVYVFVRFLAPLYTYHDI